MARLVSNLSKIAGKIPGAAERALLATGQDVLDISQQFVPVDKGDLKESGAIEVISNKELHVGYGTDHSVFQEHGTIKMEATPFLGPAFAHAEESFKVRLKDEIGKVT